MSRQVALFGLCFALAACAEMGASGTPAGTGTPVAKGQATAERVCGLCHQVLLNKPSEIEAAAPSFMEIANLPGRNRNYLTMADADGVTRVALAATIDERVGAVVFDPQTSGGLLFSVAMSHADAVREAFAVAGEPLWMIGEAFIGHGVHFI